MKDQEKRGGLIARREAVTTTAGAAVGVVAALTIPTGCKQRAVPSASRALDDESPRNDVGSSATSNSPPPTLVTLPQAPSAMPFSLALLGSVPEANRCPIFLLTVRQNKDPKSLLGMYEEFRKGEPPAFVFSNVPFPAPANTMRERFPAGNSYLDWLAKEPAARRMVMISRYADVAEIFKQTEVFTTALEEMRCVRLESNSVLGMKDTPQYHRERNAMRQAVRPPDLEIIRSLVTRSCDEYLDRHKGGIDVLQYARNMPLAYNVGYFGFGPRAGFTPQDVSRWGHDLNEDIFYNPGDFSLIRANADRAATEMKRYLEALIAETRPGDDGPVARLINYRNTDRQFDNDAIRRCLGSFIIGSHLTSSMLTTHIIAELLDRGGSVLSGAVAAAMANDDALVGQYCWEAARFRPIGHCLYRMCEAPNGQPFRLPSGAQIEGGTLVMAGVLGAGADAAAVPNPYEFRTDRPLSIDMTFCQERHTCFGVYISRVAIAEAVKRFLMRNPSAEGNQGKLEYRDGELGPDGKPAHRFYPKSLMVHLG